MVNLSQVCISFYLLLLATRSHSFTSLLPTHWSIFFLTGSYMTGDTDMDKLPGTPLKFSVSECS